MERIVCKEFDWRVGVTLGSDKCSNMKRPFIDLFIQDENDKIHPLEFTPDELQEFIEQLAIVSNVCFCSFLFVYEC